MPVAAARERSARIVERLQGLECFQAAQGVGLFWPMLERREVDLRELDSAARSSGKRVYYPFLRGTTTGFAETKHASDLALTESDFQQPAEHCPTAARGEIDLLIVPALWFALDGQRLGYGRGYYDATLPDYCPPAASVVVGFDFQLTPELPTRPGDVAVDWIVTDLRCLRAAKRADDAPEPRRVEPERAADPDPPSGGASTSASLRWRRGREPTA